MIATSFPGLLQGFFTDRLVRQRRASPHTIASYRDSFRLLLRFAQQRFLKDPTALALDDFDAPFISAFLDHVEGERRNSARTRNVRLAAIHAFFRHVAISEPAHADRCRRILAIPAKRHERRPVAYLRPDEIAALLGAPDPATWIGRRDRLLLTLAIQTGLRVSELIHLRCVDVALGAGAHVRCEGKECHAYCISFRRRSETTGTHAGRQACDLAFYAANVHPVVRRGIAVGLYTDAHGAGRVAPKSEPWAG
jgi:site-specific recombinase XerD